LKDLEVPVWLPGIKINTAPDQYNPITQLQRWTGETRTSFGLPIKTI